MKSKNYKSSLTQRSLRKKLLFPFILFSGLVSGQAFVVPDYTLSLNHAPNALLDSSVVLGNGNLSQRITYTHDLNGNLLLKNRRDVQMNQSEVSTFNYDAHDSLTQKLYATGQSAPTSTMLTVMTRNQANQVAYDTVSYNSGSQYIVNNASSYSYDGNGNLSEAIMNSYAGSWAPLNRHQYTRNAAGKVTNSLFQGWVNNAWANNSQVNTTFNNNNDLTEQVAQTWNNSTSAWKNLSRSRCVYTAAHVDTFMTYSWNNAWTALSRYTYSPAGALDSVTIDGWNGTQWTGYKRYIRTWSQGNLTSVIEKGFTNTWSYAWKYEYIYDANGNNTVTNVYGYNMPSDPWVLLIVTSHYYSPFHEVGIAEHSMNNDTKIYPVPSTGMLYFDSAEPVKSGTIYTTGGLETIRFKGSSVDLTSVTAGVYYVKLLMEDGSVKVVKAVRE